MAVDFSFKDRYNINDFLEIVRILRAPGGCPWDIEQTHESIRRGFIEETYEVIEAINKKDSELLCEELGDVLLQVVFHASIEEDAGRFNFDDVCDGISKKMIVRHPHVFGDVTVSGTGEVLSNWDEIKRRTKKQGSVSESINSIPRELPALIRAEKTQSKAAKAGFDWSDATGAYPKITEELNEVIDAAASGDRQELLTEIGDLLFAAVNVSRLLGVDPEEALTASTDKFARRFAQVEKLAGERNIDMKNSDLDVLDALWDEVKVAEHSAPDHT